MMFTVFTCLLWIHCKRLKLLALWKNEGCKFKSAQTPQQKLAWRLQECCLPYDKEKKHCVKWKMMHLLKLLQEIWSCYSRGKYRNVDPCFAGSQLTFSWDESVQNATIKVWNFVFFTFFLCLFIKSRSLVFGSNVICLKSITKLWFIWLLTNMWAQRKRKKLGFVKINTILCIKKLFFHSLWHWKVKKKKERSVESIAPFVQPIETNFSVCIFILSVPLFIKHFSSTCCEAQGA